MHNHTAASKAARMAMPSSWICSHARQAVPAEGRRVQDMAVVVEASLHSVQACCWRSAHLHHRLLAVKTTGCTVAHAQANACTTCLSARRYWMQCSTYLGFCIPTMPDPSVICISVCSITGCTLYLSAAASKDKHEVACNHDCAVTVAHGGRMAHALFLCPEPAGQGQDVDVIEDSGLAQTPKNNQGV